MKKFTNRKEYLSKLLAYKDKGLIKVVSGLRRSGKSTLFELYRQKLLQMDVQEEQIVFLNFEDFELRKFLNHLDALYAHIIGQLDLSKPCYVFFRRGTKCKRVRTFSGRLVCETQYRRLHHRLKRFLVVR